MRRGAGARQVPPAALRPKGARGSPAGRPAGGGRRCPATGSLFSPSLRPRQGGDEHCWRPSARPRAAGGGSLAPAGAVTSPLRPQGLRPEVTRWAGRGPPPRPGCGGGERSSGSTPSHKGEARNSSRTGRRTSRVGGSGGGAAVTAGRGRGLCPGILPKKPPVFSSPFPQREPGSPVQAVPRDGEGPSRRTGRCALAAAGLHPRSRDAELDAAQTRLRLSPSPPPPRALLASPPRPRPSQQAWAVSARSRRNFTAKFCSWTSPS